MVELDLIMISGTFFASFSFKLSQGLGMFKSNPQKYFILIGLVWLVNFGYGKVGEFFCG